jgi:hypothetical protein
MGTGDADLRFYIITVQDGWRKSSFLTRAWFPRTIHLLRKNSEFFYKFLKKHGIKKVYLNCLNPGNGHLNNLNAPVLNVLMFWEVCWLNLTIGFVGITNL